MYKKSQKDSIKIGYQLINLIVIKLKKYEEIDNFLAQFKLSNDDEVITNLCGVTSLRNKVIFWNKNLYVFNVDSREYNILKGHTELINELNVIDNLRAISCSDDNTLRLWNLEDGTSKLFQGHNDSIKGIKIIDNNYFVSWSNDKTFRLWNMNTSESIRLNKESIEITNVYVINSNLLISIYNSNFLPDTETKYINPVIKFWNIQNSKDISFQKKSYNHQSPVLDAAILPNNKFLSWSSDFDLLLWNLQDGSSQVFKGHTSKLIGAKLIGENQALSWSVGGALMLWNISDGTSKDLKGHTNSVKGAYSFEHGNMLISWSKDNTLRLWNLSDGSSEVYDGHNDDIEGVFVKNNKAFSWDSNGSIHIWNLNNFNSHTLPVGKDSKNIHSFLLDFSKDDDIYSSIKSFKCVVEDVVIFCSDISHISCSFNEDKKRIYQENNFLVFIELNTKTMKYKERFFKTEHYQFKKDPIFITDYIILYWSHENNLQVYDLNEDKQFIFQEKEQDILNTDLDKTKLFLTTGIKAN